MSLNAKTTAARRNAMLDLTTTQLNSGYLRIYDCTQPATADVAVTDQNLLAELRFAASAFGAASAGSALAAAIVAEDSALAAGTATWFRCFKSDGTTVVFDGSVGEGTHNLVLDNEDIELGATVTVTAFTVTQAA